MPQKQDRRLSAQQGYWRGNVPAHAMPNIVCCSLQLSGSSAAIKSRGVS
jgi:hypothetical protein